MEPLIVSTKVLAPEIGLWKPRRWLSPTFACNPNSASCILAEGDHPIGVSVESVSVDLKFAHPVELYACVLQALLRSGCAWSLLSQLVQGRQE
eukprot:71469-Amphidinium_carterae.1